MRNSLASYEAVISSVVDSLFGNRLSSPVCRVMREATRITCACVTGGDVVFAGHRHGQQFVHVVEYQHIGVDQNHSLHVGSVLGRTK